MDGKAPASPKSGSGRFVARSRAPRVQIRYQIENYGATNQKELPFIMGVLADLSGSPAKRLPPIFERKFLEFDVNNFDQRMKAMKPRVAFQVPNTLTDEGNLNVEITFESMEDFSPAAVARQVESLGKLLEAREQLANLMTYMDGKRDAEDFVAKILNDEVLLRALAANKKPENPAPAAAWEIAMTGVTERERQAAKALEASDFTALLHKKFEAQTDEVKGVVEKAVRELAAQALDHAKLISSDVVSTIKAIITELDTALSKQIDVILHHPDFQKLEGVWRGLGHLVNNTETDETLKIRVMNISKQDLGKALESDWNQSPIFKKIYEDVYGTFGAEPFGCLIGDYYFSHTAADIKILDSMGWIGAWAHTPFLAGASPMVVQLESWQELASPRDLSKIFNTPEYTAWRSLRDSEASRYIGLVMPRTLARLPYGPKNPVIDFEFEEDVSGDSHRLYTWANGVYALAININRSFKTYGWCSRIRGVESGSLVTGLPVHSFPTDDGGIATMCPTEFAIFDRREAELAKNGFIPLCHFRNTDYAAFVSVQSLWNPRTFDDVRATEDSQLAARLPYLFAACRFAHYLKCIARDRIGGFREAGDVERWLQSWIMSYVNGDVENSSEEMKSQKPLADAHVHVKAVDEGKTGHYVAEFFVRPRYQLEGLAASLRFVVHLRH